MLYCLSVVVFDQTHLVGQFALTNICRSSALTCDAEDKVVFADDPVSAGKEHVDTPDHFGRRIAGWVDGSWECCWFPVATVTTASRRHENDREKDNGSQKSSHHKRVASPFGWGSKTWKSNQTAMGIAYGANVIEPRTIRS